MHGRRGRGGRDREEHVEIEEHVEDEEEEGRRGASDGRSRKRQRDTSFFGKFADVLQLPFKRVSGLFSHNSN